MPIWALLIGLPMHRQRSGLEWLERELFGVARPAEILARIPEPEPETQRRADDVGTVSD